MNKIKIIVFISIAFVGLLFGGILLHSDETPLSELDFDLADEYHVGMCVSKTFDTYVKVYVVDGFENENKGGGFYSKEMTIVLKDFRIKIVAHEVSHLVDHIMKTKRIKDTETRAYLQGYFTECVENFKWSLP